MGLSISASAAIIFVASVIVFGTLLGAFNNAGNALIDAQRSSSERQNDLARTHFSVSSVDAANGTVSLTNDGDVTLDLDDMDVLINGTLSNERISGISVEGDTQTKLWMPGEDMRINLTGDLNGTSIEVIAGNGAVAYS